jgi:quercetin dioxygenase-like cupin family protein
MTRVAVYCSIALLISTACLAQQTDEPKVTPFAIELDKIRWRKLPFSPLEIATLVGDSNKPGRYINVVRWPPNARFKAHSHPDERYAVVLSGTFYHGFGDTFDDGKVEERRRGTFFTEPARLRHFGLTKDDGCILLFVGTGPSSIDNLEK